MEERRHNASVEKKLKDKLKTDRARIQVGRISGFGLMEMSRQRLRPGMLESTTQPCSHCHGTGLIRSDDSLGLQVLRALEEEGTRKRSKEVLLKAPIGIVNFLINQKREHIALIEARYGMSVRIEADPMLVSPDYSIEKFKTATRVVPEQSAVISGNASLMGAPVEEEEEDFVEVEEVEEAEVVEGTEAVPAAEGKGEGPAKKKRRRRRRRKPGQTGQAGANELAADGDDEGDDEGDEADAEAEEATTEAVAAEPVAEAQAAAVEAVAEEVPVKKVSSRSKSTKAKPVEGDATEAKPKTTRSRSTKAKAAEAGAGTEIAAEAVATEKPKTTRSRSTKVKPKAEAVAESVAAVEVVAPVVEMAAEPAMAALQPDPGLAQAPELSALVPDPQDARPEAAVPDEPAAPKRKGWWSLGR